MKDRSVDASVLGTLVLVDQPDFLGAFSAEISLNRFSDISPCLTNRDKNPWGAADRAWTVVVYVARYGAHTLQIEADTAN